MLFNSLQYLYFFAVLFVLYFKIVPDKYRWLLLLVASCYFYCVYIPKFILILFFLITVDYFMGRKIAGAEGSRRKKLLIVSIVANLGTLFFFKYFNFFSENVAGLAHLIHWNYSPLILQFALPLGLSFHVFQSLSYVIEVYKGKQQPEKHYGIYALYVMFFPQLVAGPIERPQHLLHQFHERHDFSAIKVRRGLELMLIGFFKKLVIADWIAQIVNHVYSNVGGINGASLFVASILFTYQIYCDFSGYSDIAVGSALVFGYDLTNNFNRPFASRSIAEFWRRWHISLSNWLRDYLYYPLAFAGKNLSGGGGKKITKYRLYASSLITFALIGLWHGANWTYVVFGTLHGIFMVLSLMTANARKRVREAVRLARHQTLEKAWQIVFTFFLVTASFVFFRAESMTQAFLIFAKIGAAIAKPLAYIGSLSAIRNVISFENMGLTLPRFAMICGFIVVLELIQYVQARKSTAFIFDDRKKPVRWAWYYALILIILFCGFMGAQSFIYFKF